MNASKPDKAQDLSRHGQRSSRRCNGTSRVPPPTPVTLPTAPPASTTSLLNFATRQPSNDAPSEVAVRLLRRIKLPPMTARALRDMLRDVIADIDADKPREGS